VIFIYVRMKVKRRIKVPDRTNKVWWQDWLKRVIHKSV